MRNGQNNNKRMRSNRPNNNNNHNNNRRGQNPMTRVFESNGPDIKIRGTASHVAEKYVQLARDARSSGDPVAAENYYQHAEHYFRLIAAAQEQLRQSQPQQLPRPDNEVSDDMGDDADSYSNFGAEPGFAPQPQSQPQPQFTPREQPQPRESYRDNRPQPQPAIQGEGDAVDRLPSFITGGAQPPVAGFEPNGQSERYAHRRRRRPRPEGAPVADNGTVPQAEDFNPGNE
ncbi:MAG: DUF4167 domain-containing protein [Xanthobacteraceae bacterium]|nr:DUF4167 domain-containing protein [Xanthobacteraceae bacterium]